MKKAEKGTRIKVVARGPNKRVLAEDSQGKEVSRVYISPRRVKVGPAGEVVMAGIGGVGTAREHRRRGIASRVYARVMQEMKRSGYSCSGLFTGTVIVAHRMYRRYGFVDISVHRTGRKLLDPKAAVARSFAGLAKRPDLADWRGVIRVEAQPYAPVYLRLDKGEVKALERPRGRVALSLTLSDTTLGLLTWGEMAPEYGRAAKLVQWRGDGEVWRRLERALSSQRPCVHGG